MYFCSRKSEKYNNYKKYTTHKMKKKFILGMAASMALACGLVSCNQGVKAPAVKLQDDIDSIAYAFGVLQGQQFAAVQDSNTLVPENIVDLNDFLAGFISAVTRDSVNLKMQPDEADAYLREAFNKIRQNMEEKRNAKIKEEKAKGAEFMAQNGQRAGVVTTEDGLQIETIVEGKGIAPAMEDEAIVSYKGSLIDGTVFDQNDSISFSLGHVVKGFSEGLMAMKEGGKAKLTIPSDLGYGDRGAGENIPGGATLVFEVELIKVNKAKNK